MENKTETVFEQLAKRGVTRRQFIRYCGMLAVVLGLPPSAVDTMANSLAAAQRLPVIWLEFQDCTGDTESFLRAYKRADLAVSGKTDPSLTELILDVLSVDYHETLMAPAGAQAEKSRLNTIQNLAGQYVCIIEGSIPTALNGYCCTIAGRTAISIAQEVTKNAKLTIALGSCAWDGGLAAAAPNPTGARGVKDVIPGLPNLINLPGCPANVVNLVATIVYFLTYNQRPSMDSYGRPRFAYGSKIHDRCERKGKGEAKTYGDSTHRAGGCVKEMGCRGPETMSNCPTAKWNGGNCWDIGAGHGCIGCTNLGFWDRLSGFYKN